MNCKALYTLIFFFHPAYAADDLQVSSAAASSAPRTVAGLHMASRFRSEHSRPRSQSNSMSPVPHLQKSKSKRASWESSQSSIHDIIEPACLPKQVHFERKFVSINKTVSIPEERGEYRPADEKVDLLSPDYFNQPHPLYDRFLRDRDVVGVPWILVCFEYGLADGSVARDYADGRDWHARLRKKMNVHPKYLRSFTGNHEYYAIDQVEKELVSIYIGTEAMAEQLTPTGDLLRNLLNKRQNPKRWHRIGELYITLGDYDSAIEWLQRALEKLSGQNEEYGYIYHTLGDAYLKKGASLRDDIRKINLEQAESWFKKALKRLQEENKPVHETLNMLGVTLRNQSKFQDASKYFLWAFSQHPSDIRSLVNLLCMFADHKDVLSKETSAEMPVYAAELLLREEEAAALEKNYADRYQKALELAKLLNPDAKHTGASPASSSSPR